MLLGSSSLRKFSFSARFTDLTVDRARWRFTADYLFHPRVNAGLEINPVVEEIGIRGNIRIIYENRYWPNLSFGTSSDRIGTPKGNQCYFLTLAKTLPMLSVAPYVSLNYSEFEDGLNFPFGASVHIVDHFSGMLMNDGRKPHAMLNYDSGHGWGLTAIWVWFEHPGAAFSYGF